MVFVWCGSSPVLWSATEEKMPNYASGSNDGPVPMEVDRVEKGKGSTKARTKVVDLWRK